MSTPFDEPSDETMEALPVNDSRKSIGQDSQISQTLEMGAAHTTTMKNKVADAYKQETAQQKDQHEAPPPSPYCVNLFNWFPLRMFCVLGGAVLVLAAILDFLFNSDAFIQFLLRVFLLISGIIIMIIEAPVWTCTRWLQTKIFFWFRILSRMWGRGWFYTFTTILCFAEFEQENPAEFVCFI